MNPRFNVFAALVILFCRDIVRVREIARECPCTQLLFSLHPVRTCNLALLKALGDPRISDCIGGFHYELDADGNRIDGTRCPCKRSFWDFLKTTHFGLRCSYDAYCWHLAISIFWMISTGGIILSLALPHAKLALGFFSGITITHGIGFEWNMDIVVVIILLVAFFGDVPAAILTYIGTFIHRGATTGGHGPFHDSDMGGVYVPMIRRSNRKIFPQERDKQGRFVPTVTGKSLD